ncbi:VOC family protein [Sphingopyxis sp. XHP0097]|uniref:VOC family protein n=1 Tax=Sphingopyxis jiangsuensis TaxID=2871171 RepID=A0ABS7M9H0_9SPHN|nr:MULTISPECIES: VOC family protein [Sphingopyxis]MBL0769867.1 VOC family protein [Sphingopyxis lutea]MBY4635667.1 VOC family protein [Sphingopyxis jiangsuensis]
MAHPFIEHVNITVSDPDRSAALMHAIFGWNERWRGPSLHGGRTIHVGSDTAYLALYTGPDGEHAGVRYPKGEPLQHIGVQVDDLDATEARVAAAGLTPFNHGDYEPGRRFYFLDPDGIEFEVVSYADPHPR